GLVALIKQANNNLTPREIKSILRNTSRFIANRYYFGEGWGRIDAVNAIEIALRLRNNNWRPPYAILETPYIVHGNQNNIVKIKGYFETPNGLKNFALYYKLSNESEDNWKLIYFSQNQPEGKFAIDWNVENIKSGTYNIKLMVEDINNIRYEDFIELIVKPFYLSFKPPHLPQDLYIYKPGFVFEVDSFSYLPPNYSYRIKTLYKGENDINFNEIENNSIVYLSNRKINFRWNTDNFEDGFYILILEILDTERNDIIFNHYVFRIILTNRLLNNYPFILDEINCGDIGPVRFTIDDIDNDNIKEIIAVYIKEDLINNKFGYEIKIISSENPNVISRKNVNYLRDNYNFITKRRDGRISEISIDDINNDGVKEILFSIDYKIYLYDSNLNLLNSISLFDLFRRFSSRNHQLIAIDETIPIGDLDNDGYKEIIVQISGFDYDVDEERREPLNSKFYKLVFVLNSDLSIKSENIIRTENWGDRDFSQRSNYCSNYHYFQLSRNNHNEINEYIGFGSHLYQLIPLSIGDLDGDNYKEVIIIDSYHKKDNLSLNYSCYTKVYLLKVNRRNPNEINLIDLRRDNPILGSAHYNRPTIADIDDDYGREIVLGISNTEPFDDPDYNRFRSAVYVLDKRGRLKQNFPVDLGINYRLNFYNLVIDHNNDNKKEILSISSGKNERAYYYDINLNLINNLGENRFLLKDSYPDYSVSDRPITFINYADYHYVSNLLFNNDYEILQANYYRDYYYSLIYFYYGIFNIENTIYYTYPQYYHLFKNESYPLISDLNQNMKSLFFINVPWYYSSSFKTDEDDGSLYLSYDTDSRLIRKVIFGYRLETQPDNNLYNWHIFGYDNKRTNYITNPIYNTNMKGEIISFEPIYDPRREPPYRRQRIIGGKFKVMITNNGSTTLDRPFYIKLNLAINSNNSPQPNITSTEELIEIILNPGESIWREYTFYCSRRMNLIYSLGLETDSRNAYTEIDERDNNDYRNFTPPIRCFEPDENYRLPFESDVLRGSPNGWQRGNIGGQRDW
ncbi:MAG: hypothetical protein NZ866_01010, partial [Patescibacteria group bacterium]|nr:hypothetical protein [Patescibacteria group bacterium]